jgi:hypothetical protein
VDGVIIIQGVEVRSLDLITLDEPGEAPAVAATVEVDRAVHAV